MAIRTDSATQTSQVTAGRASGPGTLFGVPVGDLGWFASLLVSAALGFSAFFAATFLGIVYVMVRNSSSHATLDYSLSYMFIGLPVGILVLLISLGYLGTLWVRRITRPA
jgi:predicted branched-subunit amino acid permease